MKLQAQGCAFSSTDNQGEVGRDKMRSASTCLRRPPLVSHRKASPSVTSPGSGGIPSGDCKVPNKVHVEFLVQGTSKTLLCHEGFCHLVLSPLYLILLFRLSSLFPYPKSSTVWAWGNWAGSIGNKTNKPDCPLSCVLRNFDKLYAPIVKQSYEYLIAKTGLQLSCELEWLIFRVKWPP